MMNIFTYGTLMDREIMATVGGCSPERMAATLHNFVRYRIKNEEYPGIVPHGGSKVVGVLYLDVPSEAIERLDLFEGQMYMRIPVDVLETGSDAVRPAMVYVIRPEYAERLSSEDWDFEIFMERGKQLFASCYQGFDDLRNDSKKER